MKVGKGLSILCTSSEFRCRRVRVQRLLNSAFSHVLQLFSNDVFFGAF